MKDEIKIFAGNSNRALANAVSLYVGVPLGGAEIGRFSDGEVQVEITDNVRGGDVFVMQSTCTPGNDNLMELLLMLDALKRASAKRITAVIPYYGYARQDRKVAPRVPISAKLVADLITTAGASRVLTVDLHAGQIQGFFNVPAVSTMSSMMTACRPSTWPTICTSPTSFGRARRSSMMARLASRRLAKARARSTPPASGAMTVASRRPRRSRR